MKTGTALLIIAGLSGCAPTTVTSFTDPHFYGKRYTHYLVTTPGLNMEYSSMLQSRVCQEIINQGAVCVRGLDAFPPTRQYTDEQLINTMSVRGIDGFLSVQYGSNDTQRYDIGYIMQGNANMIGNTITAYGSAMPVATFNRTDGYGVILFDVATKEKAWVGGTKTHAQGMINVTNDVFTKSLASKLVDELSRAGHI